MKPLILTWPRWLELAVTPGAAVTPGSWALGCIQKRAVSQPGAGGGILGLPWEHWWQLSLPLTALGCR